MSLFLTADERNRFDAFRKDNAVGDDLFWALRNRALARAESPGLHGPNRESQWWFCTAQYLTDAAMAWTLQPDDRLAIWLRDTLLSLVRLDEDDWIGPWFRSRVPQPPMGYLETAHMSRAIATALDLAPDVLTGAARDEVESVLSGRALPLCARWLDQNGRLDNWRCILAAAYAVTAAVLDDRSALDRAVDEYGCCLEILQPDGSYGESLQYGNYAAYHIMMIREVLTRRQPALEPTLPIAPYVHMPRWQVASYFYRKPLSGWGATALPRAANFNDSAAIFRPSADLLLHIASRGAADYPVEAGLARWLFDELYTPDISQTGKAKSGFVQDYGFLSVALLAAAVPALAPQQAELPTLMAFSNGDVLARDAWDGRTVLAVRGGGDPLHGAGHLHFDLNHFILVHNRERLLVDPGHACYRNSIRPLDVATTSHNTCTFEFPRSCEGKGAPDVCTLAQTRSGKRYIDLQTRRIDAPYDRGGHRLLAQQWDALTVVGSDAAALYGAPIRQFARFWFLCGTHALFIVDRIVSDEPVRTIWNWMFNNRDNNLELKPVPPDRIVARRGAAGMTCFHLGGGQPGKTQNAIIHDRYHPEPGQRGEGRPGSGLGYSWKEKEPVRERTVVHAIAVDSYGRVAGWHLREDAEGPMLESPDKRVRWQLSVCPDATAMQIREQGADRTWRVQAANGHWTLDKVS